MTEWNWVDLAIVLQGQRELIREYGGLDGVRDMGAVESALAQPQNLAAYGDPDRGPCGGLSVRLGQDHGFLDGNKRTAWATARVFLRGNGFEASSEAEEAVRFVEDVAGGRIDEQQAGQWFRGRISDKA